MVEKTFDQSLQLEYVVRVPKSQRATQLGQGFDTFATATISAGVSKDLVVRNPAGASVQTRIEDVLFSVSAEAVVSTHKVATVDVAGTAKSPQNRHLSSVYDPTTDVLTDGTYTTQGEAFYEFPLGSGQNQPETAEAGGKVLHPGDAILYRITSTTAGNVVGMRVSFHEEPIEALPPDSAAP